MPRPPEIIILAAVSSGLSNLTMSSLIQVDKPLSPADSIDSTEALPPSAATGSKAVPRTVITFIKSED